MSELTAKYCSITSLLVKDKIDNNTSVAMACELYEKVYKEVQDYYNSKPYELTKAKPVILNSK